MAYARSFGIGIVVILQSLEQIKKDYEKDWGVIIDNCNTLLWLGSITHNDTLEYMSKLLGKGTFDKRTTGRTTGKSGSSSKNEDVIGRDLMDAAEVRKIPKEDCILVVGGRNPFYSKKYDYKSHPNYALTSDGNHSYSYEFTPAKAPDLSKSKKQLAEEAEKHEEEIWRRAVARAAKIEERVNEAVEEIQICFDPQTLLNRIGQDLTHFAPIRDELLHPDTGEDRVALDEALMNILEPKSDTAVVDIMAQVVQCVDEIEKRVDEVVEAEGTQLITEPKEIAKEVLEIGTNLAPIRDELLHPDTGEEQDVDGFVFDDENAEAHGEDDFGDMGDAIAEIAALMQDEEEPEGENPAQ